MLGLRSGGGATLKNVPGHHGLALGNPARAARRAAAQESDQWTPPVLRTVASNAEGIVEVIDALYAASEAGARIELVVRGVCSLRPGLPGANESIRVRSVLGRFLEHSRILSFQTSDRTTTWIGSADLMPRNLDRRVEVLAPIEDARLRADVSDILDALLADTRFSWQLDSDGADQHRQLRRRLWQLGLVR